MVVPCRKEEMAACPVEQLSVGQLDELVGRLNADQRAVYDHVIAAVDKGEQMLRVVTGVGGVWPAVPPPSKAVTSNAVGVIQGPARAS
jgi:hypothetical protein